MRAIEVIFPVDRYDAVKRVIDDSENMFWCVNEIDDGLFEAKSLLGLKQDQELIDRLQGMLSGSEAWRITIIPTEAVISPQVEQDNKDKPKPAKSSANALREEIYKDVSDGADIDENFILLTILSSIVATLGVNSNNVAVVIGAMVIAPLLGPLLAFSFGAALGDMKLMLRSTRTGFVGILVGGLVAFAVSAMIPINLDSKELMDRSVVGLDSVVLALASGAAAALSITKGVSSTLVGVMVAVALLPPCVAIVLFLSAGETELASKAMLLLITNVVAVIAASQLSFILKGIGPRTWFEKKSAKKSRQINFAVWGVLLLAITVLLYFARGS